MIDKLKAAAEALKRLRKMCDPNMSHQEALMVRIIDEALYAQPKATCDMGAMCLQCPDRDANEDYKRGFADGISKLDKGENT